MAKKAARKKPRIAVVEDELAEVETKLRDGKLSDKELEAADNRYEELNEQRDELLAEDQGNDDHDVDPKTEGQLIRRMFVNYWNGPEKRPANGGESKACRALAKQLGYPVAVVEKAAMQGIEPTPEQLEQAKKKKPKRLPEFLPVPKFDKAISFNPQELEKQTVAKKKPARKGRKAGVNKSQTVRDYEASHKGKSVQEISDALGGKAKGYDYNTVYQALKKNKASKAPKATKRTTARASSNGIHKALEFIRAAGGVDQALAQIKEVEALQI